MKFRVIFNYLRSKTLGALIANAGLAFGSFLLVALIFFYLYLPTTTHHGNQVQVPDLTGMDIFEVNQQLTPLLLRYEVGDSSYSAELPPLTVLAQVPKGGHYVKENRRIYLTINRSSPPTLPLPNLFGEGAGSLETAEAILKSVQLTRGRVIYRRSPNYHLLLEIRSGGKVIVPGTRVPIGSSIDLVVGDGTGPEDFILGNLIGMPYQNALLRLGNLSLHLGSVEIPSDMDTTGIDLFVIKHLPEAGDSVSIGDPIDLWIGPKGYQFKEPADK